MRVDWRVVLVNTTTAGGTLKSQRIWEDTMTVTYGLTKRIQEISGALDKLDELAHKWQEEDAKGVRKRKTKAV